MDVPHQLIVADMIAAFETLLGIVPDEAALAKHFCVLQPAATAAGLVSSKDNLWCKTGTVIAPEIQNKSENVVYLQSGRIIFPYAELYVLTYRWKALDEHMSILCA